MRELRIVITTADAERLHGALVLAAAQTALGGRASVFLQLNAVALLREPIAAPQDEAHRAAGLPTLAVLVEEALGLGVSIIACQSGLALAGLTVTQLPDGAEVSGPVGFLQQTDDSARLIFA